MTLRPKDFADLHARHHKALFAYFLTQTGDPELAGDLLQETFERAIAAGPRYHGRTDADLRGWLRAIAYSVLRDHGRDAEHDRRASEQLGDRAVSFTPDELARFEDAEVCGQFFALVEESFVELPEDQAEAVRLRFVEDLTYEDIAKRMHTSEQAVRTRASRGLRTLRDRLEPTRDAWMRSKQ